MLLGYGAQRRGAVGVMSTSALLKSAHGPYAKLGGIGLVSRTLNEK